MFHTFFWYVQYNVEYMIENKIHLVIQTVHPMLELTFWIYCFCMTFSDALFNLLRLAIISFCSPDIWAPFLMLLKISIKKPELLFYVFYCYLATFDFIKTLSWFHGSFKIKYFTRLTFVHYIIKIDLLIYLFFQFLSTRYSYLMQILLWLLY